MARTTLSMPISPQTKEDAIRENVMRAAQHLFQQHGLNNVTLEDVARAIGKGKSTLYYYYKSKEEIFMAVMDREISEVITEVALAVKQAGTAEEKLQAFCATKLRALRKKLALYSLVCSEMFSNAEFGCTMRQRYLQRESKLLKDILAFGMETGEIRALSSQEQEALVFIMLSGLNGLELEMVHNTNNPREQDFAISMLARVMIHGIGA
ncbi:TetR/AcrR family transcriptional regulator [Hymenobacter volaticus]|uniref:TetR/AcrR family transcriptional regulator n=1 Tax=Hymenobacter volaticus TaxID=2932254 RepID=A0ABY4GCL7_9BACT|nr:TetR/AcrR family transcriptional regulator [Hymenobacter volaticus]UOQ68683.1 TetR/AcrR family transcriptional regulator [Hymenobacter volaticus]